MSRIRSKDTAPEMMVRRLVHSLGYRYRLHRNDLPGKPDLVFPGRRCIVFVNGCFWHGHGCALSSRPKSNEAFWLHKISRTMERDRSHEEALTAAGWRVGIVWECETRTSDLVPLAARLQAFLDDEEGQVV